MKPDRHAISYHTGPGGLRMVHLHVPGSPVGYTGLCVGVGSRDDDPGRLGMAHFVEHTIFKGTSRRSPWHIINRMEAVGGELNAYTTKEETVVYSVFPGSSPARAADLIADLTLNSQFPERELAKEREVVADEIDSYLDSPADAVFDDFEDLIFAGNGLGHNILGDREALTGFTSDACRDYLRRHYVPGRMVAFYAGAMNAARAFDIMERFYVFPDVSLPAPARPAPALLKPFDISRPIGSHQCHTVIGARTGGLTDDDRYATALLCNILGGPGMNSMLNVSLRERRGLVYNVEAATGLFTDCGLLTIYYGCDPADNDLCRRLVLDVISDVAGGYITARRLDRARKQYLGQTVVGSVNLESRILGLARATLTRGRAYTTAEILDRINAVTPDDIARAAAALLPASSLTLG